VLVLEDKDRFQSQSRWQQSVSRSLYMLKTVVSDTVIRQKFVSILGILLKHVSSYSRLKRRREEFYSHSTMVTLGNSVMVLASATSVMLTL